MISYSLKISGWHESPLQELDATEFESPFEDSCEFIIGLFSSFRGIKFIKNVFLNPLFCKKVSSSWHCFLHFSIFSFIKFLKLEFSTVLKIWYRFFSSQFVKSADVILCY